MKTSVILLILGVAVIGLGAWFLLQSGIVGDLGWFADGDSSDLLWWIEATDPLLIGDLQDPYVYAGGDAVRSLPGESAVRIFGAAEPSTLQATINLNGTAIVLTENLDPTSSLELGCSLQFEDVLFGQTVHGETGQGDHRLPETHALLAGSCDWEVSVNGASRGPTYRGAWAVADAIRQEDGSIRNQGLVFSPLLRDNTVFSDPSRLELTLLVYGAGATPTQTDSVVLHLVYQDVRVIAAPEEANLTQATTRPEE